MIKNTFVLLLLLFFSAAVGALSFSYTLKLTEQEVQAKIEEKMPFKKKKYFITVTIKHPQIKLKNGNNKIGVLTDVSVQIPGVYEGIGNTYIEGNIEYKAKSGEFFLTSPEVKDLTIENLPENYSKNVTKVVDFAVKKSMSKFPIYQFKDDNFKHQLAKSSLKSVKIQNGVLALELGI